MTDKEALFILKHGSAEGDHKFFEAIDVIEDLVYRQKAKIEALKMDCEQLKSDVSNALCNLDNMEMLYNESRADAVKELKERLDAKSFSEWWFDEKEPSKVHVERFVSMAAVESTTIEMLAAPEIAPETQTPQE